MITIGGQTFDSYYCSWCGAQDTEKERMAKHEEWHRSMSEWCKGLTTYSRESSRYLSDGIKDRVKCLEAECQRMAVAKGRCQRCYARVEAIKRQQRTKRVVIPRQKKSVSAGILIACIAGAMGDAWAGLSAIL